jgi:hypothetical protein
MRNRLVITSATSAQSFRLAARKPRKLKAVFQISSGKLHEAVPRLTVAVKALATTHDVPVNKIEAWLQSNG